MTTSVGSSSTSSAEQFPSIPLSGEVVRGSLVQLHWPTGRELDLITHLRNRKPVRHWFIDDRELDPVANRLWLTDASRRPSEALLSIAILGSGRWLGTIGWSDWNPRTQEAEFGRLMVCTAQLAASRASGEILDMSPMRDAALALRRFAFREMKLRRVLARVLDQNVQALRFAKELGFTIIGQAVAQRRSEATPLSVVSLALTRETYLASSPDDLGCGQHK